MSEVTEIHIVGGITVTVDGNFIAELTEMPSITTFQSFNNRILVNLDNVAYMEVVDDDQQWDA